MSNPQRTKTKPPTNRYTRHTNTDRVSHILGKTHSDLYRDRSRDTHIRHTLIQAHKLRKRDCWQIYSITKTGNTFILLMQLFLPWLQVCSESQTHSHTRTQTNTHTHRHMHLWDQVSLILLQYYHNLFTCTCLQFDPHVMYTMGRDPIPHCLSVCREHDGREPTPKCLSVCRVPPPTIIILPNARLSQIWRRRVNFALFLNKMQKLFK